MNKKIIIFVCLFVVLSSLFIVSVSADSITDPFVPGFYFVRVPDDFTSNVDIDLSHDSRGTFFPVVFGRQDNPDTKFSRYQLSGGFYYDSSDNSIVGTYKSYSNGLLNTYSHSFDRRAYVFLVYVDYPTSLIDGLLYYSLDDYGFSTNLSVGDEFVFANDMDSFFYNLDFSLPCSFSLYDLYTNQSLGVLDSLTFYSYESSPGVFEYRVSLFLDGQSIGWIPFHPQRYKFIMQEDYSLKSFPSNESSIFYSCFSPFSFYEIPAPSPSNPSLADFTDVVTEFVVSVFNGLDYLIIYPGISILTLIYAVVGIYFVRFLLKLIAGG